MAFPAAGGQAYDMAFLEYSANDAITQIRLLSKSFGDVAAQLERYATELEQTERGRQKELNKQIDDANAEIERLKGLMTPDQTPERRQELKDQIQRQQEALGSLQQQLQQSIARLPPSTAVSVGAADDVPQNARQAVTIGSNDTKERPMTRVPMPALVEFGVAFMTKAGVPPDKARHVAETVIETEAFRQTTHGLIQYARIHEWLGTTVDPTREPAVVRESDAAAMLDGDRCLPILVMKTACDLAVRKARAGGTAAVSARNCGWIAALGIHTARVARQGFLAQAWAQSSSCLDCAPVGGRDACFSTNPIALAFPSDGDPVVADFSTATMSMAATGELIRHHRTTPVARFLDADGNPTCDPAVVRKGGSLFFAGGDTDGHKGYALSLFNEALTVVAGGSANNPDVPSRQSFGITVIDPAHFAGQEHYTAEMTRFLARVRASRPRPGVDRVRLPGERGFAALANCCRHGVPLDDEKIALLRTIAEARGVPLPEPLA